VCEAAAHAFEQSPQLLVVVDGDELPCRPSATALVLATAARRLSIHAGNVAADRKAPIQASHSSTVGDGGCRFSRGSSRTV
jgi:hypothetical protein